MSLLAIQLGAGGIFVLYEFVRRTGFAGMDSVAWILLIGGLLMLSLLWLSWTDYRARNVAERQSSS